MLKIIAVATAVAIVSAATTQASAGSHYNYLRAVSPHVLKVREHRAAIMKKAIANNQSEINREAEAADKADAQKAADRLRQTQAVVKGVIDRRRSMSPPIK